MKHLPLLLPLLLLWGCDDTADSEEESFSDRQIIDAQTQDQPLPLDLAAPPPQDQGLPLDGPPLDALPQDLPDLQISQDLPPLPTDAIPLGQPAWIELSLSPRRSIYALSAQPQGLAEIFQSDGSPVEDQELSWHVEPPEAATVDEEGLLSFLREGAGRLLACVGEICGHSSFFVDEGPPSLELESPARGALLVGSQTQTIRVQGRAWDSGGEVEVWINGIWAQLDGEGRFSLDIPARFGLNTLEISADDGIQPKARHEILDVLWAPEYQEGTPNGVQIPQVISFRVDQALLDQDAEPNLPAAGESREYWELAQLLSALIELAEVDTLLGDPQIVNSEMAQLSLTALHLGRPEIDFSFSAEGMNLFIRLPEISLETEGFFDLEGSRLDLDGEILATVAAFVELRLSLEERLSMEVGELGVTVEALSADYPDEAAEILVGTLGSQLRSIVDGMASQLIEGLMRSELPTLMDVALEQIFGDGGVLSEMNLDLQQAPIEGLPPVQMSMSFLMESLAIRPREGVSAGLDLLLDRGEPTMLPYEDPGVPLLSPEQTLIVPGEGLGIAMRLGLLNGILHELWRAGLLQLQLPMSGLQAHLDARLPPVVAPLPPGSRFPLEVQLGDLRLETTMGEAERGDRYAMTLRVGVNLRLNEGRFELEVAEEPEIKAILLESASGAPLIRPEGLVSLLEVVLWPRVEEALAGGLGFEIPPMELPVDSLQAYTPNLESLTLHPEFAEIPQVIDGRVRLEGGLRLELKMH